MPINKYVGRKYANGGSVQSTAQKLQSMGRNGDTILAHINPKEAALLKRMGGSGKINPNTGLMSFEPGFGGFGSGASGNYGGGNVSGGSAAGWDARGGGSPGFGTGGGGSVGGGGGYGGNSPDVNNPGGNSGGGSWRAALDAAQRAADDAKAKATQAEIDKKAKAAKEAAEKQKTADDAKAKATQVEFDKKAREAPAKKEADDQLAREAAVAKAAEERRVREAAPRVKYVYRNPVQKAADDAKAKATQAEIDKKAREAPAKKEADDQLAREAAVAKAAEERRVREAAEAAADARREQEQQRARAEAAAQETARVAQEAADRESASQQARAEAAAQETARVAQEAADRESASQRARAEAAAQETARVAQEAADRESAQQQAMLNAAKKVTTEAMVDRVAGKIITVESGGDPNAQNPTSSAKGLGQFIDKTWMGMIRKYRPDLLTGRTEAEVLSLKTDPALSVEMTKNYVRENSEGLTNAGFPVNEGTLYLSHFLGLGGAINMLNAAADTPASVVAGGGAATANPTVLGGGKTAADVLKWADLKMGGTTSFDIANLTSTTPAQVAGGSGNYMSGVSTAPSTQSADAGSNFDYFYGTPVKPVQYAEGNTGTRTDSTVDSGEAERLPPSSTLYADDDSNFDYFYGTRPDTSSEAEKPSDPANVAGGSGKYMSNAPEAEKPWYDKLIGDFNSLFDSTSQITALEDQGKLAGGLTKQEYANKFAGGDLSKVQSRIVDYGQGPQVDYYSKSLGDKFGEAVSDLGKGITSLFGGETSTAMQPIVADPFVPTGFGPYGDLTREQYNEQYGGSDIATNLPPTGTPTTPKTPKTPVVPPVEPTGPVKPTGPVMPTVPNFATAQRYTGTPTVATKGFDFSKPFAPRPPIDFANLGPAYAPTALSTAPPVQPLPGIPGALYAASPVRPLPGIPGAAYATPS